MALLLPFLPQVNAWFDDLLGRGEYQNIPVGAMGWTQDSVASKTYNIQTHEYEQIRAAVERLRNDPRGAERAIREDYEPIRVFPTQEYGLLSIDNRRLAVFRMVLPVDRPVRVRLITREQADNELRSMNGRGLCLQTRMTTHDGGYSIVIRRGHNGVRETINQSYPVVPGVHHVHGHGELR